MPLAAVHGVDDGVHVRGRFHRGGIDAVHSANIAPRRRANSQFKETARQGRTLGRRWCDSSATATGRASWSAKTRRESEHRAERLAPSTPATPRRITIPHQPFGAKTPPKNTATRRHLLRLLHPLLSASAIRGEAYFMSQRAGAVSEDPNATVADCQQSDHDDFDNLYKGVTLCSDCGGATGSSRLCRSRAPETRRIRPRSRSKAAPATCSNTTTARRLSASTTSSTGQHAAANNNDRPAWRRGDVGPPAVVRGTRAETGRRRAMRSSGDRRNRHARSPQTVNSLTFKTSGYTINGSTLTSPGDRDADSA